MAIGAGIAGQLGAKKETTYGTGVTVDNWFEFGNETIACDVGYIYSNQIRGGRTFQSSTRRAQTVTDAAGSISMEVPNKGFGFWLDLLHGNTVTPVQVGGTIAYLQTHDVGATDPSKSATIQVGRPDSSGTVQPFSYTGSMVTGYSLACGVGEWLTASFDINAQNETTATALATASFPTALEGFTFKQGTVTIASVAVADVRSFTLNGGNPRKVDRHFLGSSGLKAKPITNDYTTAEGSLNVEFTNLTHYNRYKNSDISSVVLYFEGSTIAASNKYFLRITMSAAGFTGATPQVAGNDVVYHDLPFLALDNGSAVPLKFEYQEIRTTAL